MTVDRPTPVPAADPEEPSPEESGRAARRLLRTALTGALATLDHRNQGHPYASLVLIATDPDGAPLTLISQLALHTRNLLRDPRASLLIDSTAGLGDPMAGGRLTLTGEARPTKSPTALRRFLARHSYARAYANLPGFLPYAFEVSGGHYIGGFGQIVELPATALATGVAEAAELVAAEPDILAHMNDDHAEAVALYATELAKRPPGAWRLCGIDPEGIDLVHCNSAARVEFGAPVRTADEARLALVALARQGRARRDATA